MEMVEKPVARVYGLDILAATRFCVPPLALPNRYSCPLMVATDGSSIQAELSWFRYVYGPVGSDPALSSTCVRCVGM